MMERVKCPVCKRMVRYNELGAVDVQYRPVLSWHYTSPTSGIECRMGGHSPLDERYLTEESAKR